jgi:hypothetical protein
LIFVVTKEKLEIVIGAAPPHFRIFAGGLFSPPQAAKCVRTILIIQHHGSIFSHSISY